jgi:hypothetical protein
MVGRRTGCSGHPDASSVSRSMPFHAPSLAGRLTTSTLPTGVGLKYSRRVVTTGHCDVQLPPPLVYLVMLEAKEANVRVLVPRGPRPASGALTGITCSRPSCPAL